MIQLDGDGGSLAGFLFQFAFKRAIMTVAGLCSGSRAGLVSSFFPPGSASREKVMDIPVSPYQQFWFALAEVGEDGWAQAQKAMICVVRRRYPTCYFDYEALTYRALELAVQDFDPSKGKVITHLCNKAIGVASDIIRTKSHYSKWEWQFADIEAEDKPSIEERTAAPDEYSHGQYNQLCQLLSCTHFEWVPKCADKTMLELAFFLAADTPHIEIAKRWRISIPTLKLCIEELQEKLASIPGLLSEYLSGTV